VWGFKKCCICSAMNGTDDCNGRMTVKLLGMLAVSEEGEGSD
jgi:hypothetical protein